MAQGLGIKGLIQFGREAFWGTAVPATHRIGFESCTIEAKPQIARSQNMPAAAFTGTAWARDPNNAGINVVGEYAEGQIVVPMDYDGLLQFIDMCFGTTTFGSYGASVSGVGPFTHTFGPTRETMNSATLEIREGGVNASAVARVLGAKVVGLTLSGKGAAGDEGVLRLTLDIIGQQKQLGQTITAAITSLARVPVYFSHLTGFDDGSGDAAPVLREFELSIKPAMAAPEFKMGSAFIREPIRNGLVETRLKLTREYTSDSLITAFKAGTLLTSKPNLAFASGTKSMNIALNYAKVIEAPQPVPSLRGLMMQEVTYEALWDGTNGECTIEVVSAQNGAAA